MDEKRTLAVASKPEGVKNKDLVVYAKNKITLSYNNEQFKNNYKILKPTSIDEVKQAIGVPKEIVLNKTICCDSKLKSTVLGISQIQDRKKETSELLRLAAREYVHGNYNKVLSWSATLDEWLKVSGAAINIAIFHNIVVQDGGVLQVASDTHALNANSIKLYGTGTIYAEGDLSISCATMEGKL